MIVRFTATILLLLALAPAASAKAWRVREGCTLVENPANDGDSFHVRMGKRTYIFRLLWVDAPETDDRFPERVAEQSAYFGIGTQAIFRAGREAQRFTREFLSRQPFTVYTQFADARGASEKNRYYAIVKSGDTFLMEALVANGLARIHGIQIMPPDTPSESVMRMRLRGLEADAKRNRRGAWGLAGPALNRFEQLNRPVEVARQTLTLARHLPIFAADDPTRMLGTLRPGTEITVLRAESFSHVRVRFRLEDGQAREALARRIDLGL
jgi:endonuclease YncB( thermonuclease family)